MVDELIREVTEPDDPSPGARAAARERLLLAAQAEEKPSRSGGRRRRALKIVGLLALLAVPTGVAVAAELSGDSGQTFLTVADCPALLADAEQRGLETDGLRLASCPEGDRVLEALSLLVQLEKRRGELGEGEAAIGVIGGAPGERSWSTEGVVGTTAEGSSLGAPAPPPFEVQVGSTITCTNGDVLEVTEADWQRVNELLTTPRIVPGPDNPQGEPVPEASEAPLGSRFVCGADGKVSAAEVGK